MSLNLNDYSFIRDINHSMSEFNLNDYIVGGFVRKIEQSMYQKLANVDKKYSTVMRFAGFPIGMAKALLNLVERVAVFGEALIKGMVNLVKGETMRAKDQLILAGFEVLGLLGAGIYASIDVIYSTALFALDLEGAKIGAESSISSNRSSSFISNVIEREIKYIIS